ncbi:thioredoxin-like protein AAED1, chloroplastic [Mangifera indica]|uniref:thioredoxin-like protein AAED1, chloroplastic n=1 Tax=Mangifera indica TaxID=29780 RepID=UPI001CFA002F|nr:thioredoxin-like protein AAED1, chloroplastic [Mangifera indica]
MSKPTTGPSTFSLCFLSSHSDSVMAISLSFNTLQLNTCTNHLSMRAFPNQSSNLKLLRFLPTNFTHAQPSRLFAASAVSNSPGIEASSSVGEEIVNSLDSVKVFDLNGNEILVSNLWKDRKAVVAFARHFGCVLCRKRADYLASKKDVMDASGVALVLIGPGSVEQARTFSEQTKFKGEVYADPSHSSYDALSFVSGVSTTFTPKAGLKIIQSYMAGYRQDWKLSFEKDTVSRGGWRQGGIIVAGPGKSNILYIHKDKEAGDDPNIEDI